VKSIAGAVLVCLYLSLCAVHAANVKQAVSSKVEYPKISSVEGSVEVRQKGELLKGKLPGRILREQILLETGKGASIRVDLAPHDFILLAEDSKLLIPAIDWETGQVEELELLVGSFGLELKEARQIRSELFRDRITEGRYIFDYSPLIPQFGVTVLKGELAFRGRENEERSALGSGDRQIFVGEIQDGQIQFDVLLEGRKVARGRMLGKEKLKATDMASFNKAFELRPVRKAGAGKTSKKGGTNPSSGSGANAGAEASRGLLKDAICKKPAGRFNDCAYECVNNPKGQKICNLQNPKVSCVRRRCLASGRWGDEHVFANHLATCDAQIKVQICDY
jgi:hypothetical protein